MSFGSPLYLEKLYIIRISLHIVVFPELLKKINSHRHPCWYWCQTILSPSNLSGWFDAPSGCWLRGKTLHNRQCIEEIIHNYTQLYTIYWFGLQKDYIAHLNQQHKVGNCIWCVKHCVILDNSEMFLLLFHPSLRKTVQLESY